MHIECSTNRECEKFDRIVHETGLGYTERGFGNEPAATLAAAAVIKKYASMERESDDECPLPGYALHSMLEVEDA